MSEIINIPSNQPETPEGCFFHAQAVDGVKRIGETLDRKF